MKFSIWMDREPIVVVVINKKGRFVPMIEREVFMGYINPQRYKNGDNELLVHGVEIIV